MKIEMRVSCLTVLAFALPVFASKGPPFERENAIVDRIFLVATSGTSSSTGLQALEAIAEGRPEAVSPTVAAAAGLKLSPEEMDFFRDDEVRAHAIYKIAEIESPEAFSYLEALKPKARGATASGLADAAIGLAYRQAVYLREKDPQRRIELLESALGEKSIPAANSAIHAWAEAQLCNAGQMTSLPVIQKSMLYWNPGEHGQAEFQYCEARMRIVWRDPDRVKALSSVLTMSSSQEDRRLIEWAVAQLDKIDSPATDLILDQYAAAIDRLPERSPVHDNLFGVVDQIQHRKARGHARLPLVPLK